MTDPNLTPYVYMCNSDENKEQYTLLEGYLKSELVDIQSDNWIDVKQLLGERLMRLSKREKQFIYTKRYAIASTFLNAALFSYIFFRK